MTTGRRNRILIASALILALVGAGLWAGLRRDRPETVLRPDTPTPTPSATATPPEVTLKPLAADGAGMESDSRLRLTSTLPLTAGQVSAALSADPPVKLEVRPEGAEGKSFLIEPAKVLESGKVYRFQLAPAAGVSRPYRWSFQTKSAFRIVGSLPRDRSSGVPVNTGIELLFSHDSYEEPGKLFSITPTVEGRFERHKKVLAFVPKEPLKPGTVYTVTLAKGLKQRNSSESLPEPFSFSFETAPTMNSKGGSIYFNLSGELQEFPVGDAPFFSVAYHKQGNSTIPPVGVSVWRYDSAEPFARALVKLDQFPWWASHNRSQQRFTTDGLQRVAEFTAQPKALPDAGTYLLFPEPLPAGFYLAEFRLEDQVRQALFQVTNLSSFISMTTSKTLVWLNDLSTKAPAVGVEIAPVGDGDRVRTDAKGVAVLQSPARMGTAEAAARSFYMVATDPQSGAQAVMGASLPGYYYYGGFDPGRDQASAYWKYLYLDRALYKPDDLVNVWGVLHPREAGAEPVSSVRVELIRYEYRGPDDKPLPLAVAELPLINSTFTGDLKLPNLRPGGYEVQLFLGDSRIQSRWLEVQTYTKPTYQLEIEPSRHALKVGETMEFKVRATFFEGTPVPNLPLNYHVSGAKGDGGTVRTDANGEAVVPFAPSNTSPGYGGGVDAGGPHHLWFHVNAGTPEVGTIDAQTSVQFFTRDVMFRPTVKEDPEGALLTLKAQKVDLSAYPGDGKSSYLGDPAPGRPVRGTLVEQNWIREEAGEYYDFINKVVQKNYRYRMEERTVATFEGVTDEAGNFSKLFETNREKGYVFRLEVLDTENRPASQQLFFSGRFYREVQHGRYRYYHLDSGNTFQWGLDEDILLSFRENRAVVPDRKDGFLFYTARLGLQTYQVQDGSTWRYRLTEADLPNTNVAAVHFDGRMYREARERAVRFNPESRRLSVAVKTDKEAYRPGETVRLAVEVVDSQKRPVRAQVNLNLVDEALFALRDQSVNLLGSLYGEFIGSGILRTRKSHATGDMMGGAEKGGEGGGVRKEFKDAVFFKTVSTDANGKATASFAVPDNLTSWRLTYQAIAPERMMAGSGNTKIPVKLPFFVDLVRSEQYLSDDHPVLVARGYGSALKDGDPIRFTLKVTAPDGSVQTESLTGPVFTAVPIQLPALKEGRYLAELRAEGPNGLTDAMELPFQAHQTYLRRTQVDLHTLAEGLKVNGSGTGITTLSFSDLERSQYLRLLQQMRWQWGNRVEQKLARTAAADLLSRHFGLQRDGDRQEWDPHRYQTPKGGIAILPYADEELRLSALAADLDPDQFDRIALLRYFDGILNDRKSGRAESTQALYGMAALGEPVLVTVQSLLGMSDLSLDERLYLLLAAAELGDLEGVRPLYRQLIERESEAFGTAHRIKGGSDQDEILSQTALAGVVAAKLGEPEATGFAEYLAANHPKEQLLLVEQLLMVQAVLPRLSTEPAAFSYRLDGKEHSRELKPGESFRLSVPAAALPSLQFTKVTGKVGVTAAYEVDAKASDLMQQDGFKLSRTYQVNGVQTDTFRPGDLVKVTIDYRIPETAPAGSYEIADYLPSGFRLIERPWEQGAGKDERFLSWPLEVNGQRVVFWAWKSDRPIVYFARVALPGQYTAEEPILLQPRSGTIFSHGLRDRVKIEW